MQAQCQVYRDIVFMALPSRNLSPGPRAGSQKASKEASPLLKLYSGAGGEMG